MVVGNPVLRTRRLAHVRLADGRYETIAVGRDGCPCDLLSGGSLRAGIESYRTESAREHARSVLAAFDAGHVTYSSR